MNRNRQLDLHGVVVGNVKGNGLFVFVRSEFVFIMEMRGQELLGGLLELPEGEALTSIG